MEWILFDKDGTLIEFDRSWEKIGDDLYNHCLRLSQYIIKKLL